MGKRDLTAWIERERAAKRWVQPCLSCGTWFSEPRHVGRRAIICRLHRCSLYRKYQNDYGRAPPARLQAKWRAVYGDAARINMPKRTPERRAAA